MVLTKPLVLEPERPIMSEKDLNSEDFSTRPELGPRESVKDFISPFV